MATPLSWFAMQTTAGQWVGVARQIGKDRFGPCERALGVDHPFDLAQWREMGGEGVAVGEAGKVVEEAEMPGFVGGAKLLQEQPAEQPREHPDRQKEPRPTRDPPLAVR